MLLLEQKNDANGHKTKLYQLKSPFYEFYLKDQKSDFKVRFSQKKGTEVENSLTLNVKSVAVSSLYQIEEPLITHRDMT